MNKLIFSAWRFDRETNGNVLKVLESKELDKEFFRHTLKSKMDCRLTNEEFEALFPHFANGNSVNGVDFLLLFYRVRFEYKSKLLTERVMKEKKIREDENARLAKRHEEFEGKNKLKLNHEFTEEEKASALTKLSEAAFRYDRLMPGAIQLNAFDCEYMQPETFKEQLKLVFNMHLTSGELGALVQHLSKDGEDRVNCAQFLVTFFRMGFRERSTKIKAKRDEVKRITEEKEAKKRAEQEELEKKNAAKVSFNFTKEDEKRVLKKISDAARLYDQSSPSAISMKSFEVAFMPPHIFKEQLKRVFNLDLTPEELGALIMLYDGPRL